MTLEEMENLKSTVMEKIEEREEAEGEDIMYRFCSPIPPGAQWVGRPFAVMASAVYDPCAGVVWPIQLYPNGYVSP
jgi:hypothetical protein